MEIASTLVVEPAALLAHVPTSMSPEALNRALAAQGLALPLAPLLPGLSLATLLERNAGGRRRLRYGPLGRYVRAALLEDADGTQFTIGGPTIKRATGYALWRALAGGSLAIGRPLRLTLSLRPLPPRRVARLLRCTNVASACRLGGKLAAAGLALSALAFARLPTGDAALLVELEEHATVVTRQMEDVTTLAQAEGAAAQEFGATPWAIWETLAAAQVAAGPAQTLDLTLPQAQLSPFVAQAERAAQRYGVPLQIWGDAGLGALHLVLMQAEPVALLDTLAAMAHTAGGQGATELGVGGWKPRIAPLSPYGNTKNLKALPPSPTAWERGQGGEGHPWHPSYENTKNLKALPPSPTAWERGQGGEGHPWHPYNLSVACGANALPAHEAASGRGGTPFNGCAISSESILAQLRTIVGPRYLLTRREEVACYDLDASLARPAGAALAVALPRSTAEVAALVRVAAAHGVPLVCRGAGSGLAGGSVPSAGALVLALNRLDGLEIDQVQRVARVGAGAVTADVQRAAAAVGLCYPPDPSSQSTATLGGNLACNAGGPRCVKYGVTSDYLLGVTAVLANGQVVTWGDGLIGQGLDNDLAQLLVGAEGTLGVITEATLRLITAPRSQRTTLALFAHLEDACATVERIMAAGIVPAAMELMDDVCLAAVEAYIALGLPPGAGAMLLMLADGEAEAVADETAQLVTLAQQGGATLVESARSAADEGRLWQARRAVSIALTRIRPRRLGEDICVPLTRIAECAARISAIAAHYELPIAVFGHAGDGNLHPNILFDPADPREMERLWPCAAAVFNAALAVGGTLSGEHGIGTLKQPFMNQALSAGELVAQRCIKAQFDPMGILNPGKVLPLAESR
ncbi:MAG: FAD-binding oxidoreductase [Candidatus Viridilinea halotolerans]|uniref:FAD-binding oxidoreductase n=1 Tax=Candidatus Viridilinea halotolerans TaxID=2491704 RepID=A0A426TTP2_9CHLR|nr:MAG: FAD-binding oxidoreductase [Candidatus Viridilinea halotolerans]